MKIIFEDRFTAKKAEIIRVALIVAEANFELPGTIRVGKLDEEDARYNDGMIGGNNRILVRAGLSGAALFSTVSHEAKHVSQIYKGELDSDMFHFYWKGRKVPARVRYENLPHEKEAFAYEYRLIPKRK